MLEVHDNRGMEENKKTDQKQDGDKGPPKFNFNSYWIYGIIILLLVGFNLMYFPDSGGAKINFSDFESFALAGDVDRLEIVNNTEAQVYIKQDKLNKSEHADARKNNFSRDQAQYYFTDQMFGCPHKERDRRRQAPTQAL